MENDRTPRPPLERRALARRTQAGLTITLLVLAVWGAITSGPDFRADLFSFCGGVWLILAGLCGIYFREEYTAMSRGFWSSFLGDDNWRVRLYTPTYSLVCGILFVVAGVLLILIGASVG